MAFNGWTFLFQILNFVVLVAVLYRILFRPMREAIDRRRQAIEKVRDDANVSLEAALRKEEELNVQLASVERERQETIRKALEQTREQCRNLLADSDRAIQLRHEQCDKTMELERRQSIDALQSEVVSQAVELASRLLREAFDADLHRQLLLRLQHSLAGLTDEEQSSIRQQWQGTDGVVLESADDVDGASSEALRQTVSTLLGTHAELTIRRCPELLWGARLRIGGEVWDASVAGQLAVAEP